MSGSYLLAIDAGTGSCRAMLFTEKGEQVASSLREWTHREPPGVPGGQDFDVARQLAAIAACIRDALGQAGATGDDVRAVAATSMREGIVLYDAAGREIWACPNVDSRSAQEAVELIAEGAAERIYADRRRLGVDHHARRGCAGWPGTGRTSWPRRRAWACSATGSRPGCPACWRPSHPAGRARGCSGWRTGPGRRRSRRSAASTARSVCRRSPTRHGDRHRHPARCRSRPACEPGTPVVGGRRRHPARPARRRREAGRVHGASAARSGRTRSCSTGRSSTPQIRLRTLCHVVPGQWMLEGIGFYCGMSMRWFRDAFCAAEVGAGPAARRRPVRRHGGSRGAGAAGLRRRARHLVQHHERPALGRTRARRSCSSASAADPAGRRQAACVRAIEEAAAFVARGHRDIITELTGTSFTELVFTGGAAKGTLWPQIMADVLGVPVHVPAVTESSALGAAICAGSRRRNLRRACPSLSPTCGPGPGTYRAGRGSGRGLRRAVRHLAAGLPADARHVRRRPAQPALAGGRCLADLTASQAGDQLRRQ